jgi:CzcA family heavy metal efflux pump
MLDRLIDLSLQHRMIILLLAVLLMITGTWTAFNLPVDVFPDLTATTITIMTEAHGLAPEEIEAQVTFPIETAVNGASGVRRVRSISIQGLSTVWVEFDWGSDIQLARQIVNEKLQNVQTVLPEDADTPVLAPITSIMGEIMLVGLTAETTPSMDLRTMADYDLRRRLMAVPGVAQVLVYGGEVKQYQVIVDPYRLSAMNVTLEEVVEAVSESNVNASGGLMIQHGQEMLIRGLGRVHSLQDLEQTVVTVREGVPLRLGDVAEIQIGAAQQMGTVGINMQSGVILLVSKQPDVNTLHVTDSIDEVLAELATSLPSDVTMHTEIFRQSDFIELAVQNVFHALRDGAILVVIILFIFLQKLRTTIISLLAIPLSLVIAIFVLRYLDLTINTMTLGGMAIAIGSLVDDAIIFVENIYRRLRENIALPEEKRRAYSDVVADASKEIRGPTTIATLIIIIVFLPLFFLSGVEGRMLLPLGIAYVVAVLASLLVALTLTPALSSYLLTSISPRQRKESWLVSNLKRWYRPVLEWSLDHRAIVLSSATVLVIAAMSILPFMGRSFLPEFNEGTLTISIASVPGTSLDESDNLGLMVESILLSHPEVLTTARRTGRTELDEHSMGSHAHEIEVQLDLSETSKEELLERLRADLTQVPGSNIIIGQPISHRIDHMLSGTRANIAVKIFGSDLDVLRGLAGEVELAMEDVPGIVDLAQDPQIDVVQVHIHPNREELSLAGLRVADVDEMMDAAFLGEPVSQVIDGTARHDLIVRYAPEFRDRVDVLRNSLLDSPVYGPIPLSRVAKVELDVGPNVISRENVQRKTVIQANVAGRDLRGTVNEVQKRVDELVDFPKGYHVEFGGQFESEEQATRTVLTLSIVALLGIILLLYIGFHSLRQATLVLVTLPLALIGGVVSVFFADGIISIASLVGFITLFGIAVRNGVLMVSHYNHLLGEESASLREAVVRGSLERMNPVLMTALTTGLALIPLALAADKPGSEIQAPMSMVILGGLLTATFLTLIVLPVLYARWGVKRG